MFRWLSGHTTQGKKVDLQLFATFAAIMITNLNRLPCWCTVKNSYKKTEEQCWPKPDAATSYPLHPSNAPSSNIVQPRHTSCTAAPAARTHPPHTHWPPSPGVCRHDTAC